MDIGFGVMCASGFERPDSPTTAAERVEILLESMKESFDIEAREVVVCDDWSENEGGRKAVEAVCRQNEVPYLSSDHWRGVAGNYNFAVENLRHEWVALLSDDQIASKDFSMVMDCFLYLNRHSPIGMVGWSVVFAEDMVRNGVLENQKEFYTNLSPWWKKVEKEQQKILQESSKWGCSEKPYLRGHCSGSAFALRRDLWKKMGGFFEGIYQPDEDFGDWVWNSTDHLCVQVPTPIVYHYGGGSSFGTNCESDTYANCADNWIKRPHGVGEDFKTRGRKAALKIAEVETPKLKFLEPSEW